jgi:hypothetical protein
MSAGALVQYYLAFLAAYISVAAQVVTTFVTIIGVLRNVLVFTHLFFV